MQIQMKKRGTVRWKEKNIHTKGYGSVKLPLLLITKCFKVFIKHAMGIVHALEFTSEKLCTHVPS